MCCHYKAIIACNWRVRKLKREKQWYIIIKKMCGDDNMAFSKTIQMYIFDGNPNGRTEWKTKERKTTKSIEEENL